jgi:O-methyltransferase involved in polyketide biosynthesis
MTVWVLEGFLSYITAQQQGELAALLHRLSAPGSRLLASAPPTEASRQQLLAMGVKLYHVNYNPVEAVAARFAVAGWAVQEILSRQQLEQQYGIDQHLDLFVLQR